MRFSRRQTRPFVVALAVAIGLGGCGPAKQDTDTSPALASASPTASNATTPSTSPTPSPSVSPPAKLVAPRYAFPVLPVSRARFGHSHHDYPATDIFANCGDTYRAAVSGTVTGVERTDRWHSTTNVGAVRGGLSVTLVGLDGVRYYGSHLGSIEPGIVVGQVVSIGQALGRVGDTGSARGTPCHVHFGISPPCATTDWYNRRGLVYPWPYLESWRAGGQLSPVAAVAAYRKAHGCPTGPVVYP